MNEVFCVIPVHNRLLSVKNCINYLSAQNYYPINTIVVDDGSTDGTYEYLTKISQTNFAVLRGDGNLWWGGAMRLGMQYVLNLADADDYLLMLNDDVVIGSDYVFSLVRESLRYQRAIVGSVQRCEASGVTMGRGFSINYFVMEISLLDDRSVDVQIDALPGRGTLYPVSIIRRVGLINSKLFPHYFGDIEYSARAKDKGYTLVICQDANVYTNSKSSDQDVRVKYGFFHWFSFRSKDNLVHRLVFFSIRGPRWLRLCTLLRFIIITLYKTSLYLVKGRRRKRAAM